MRRYAFAAAMLALSTLSAWANPLTWTDQAMRLVFTAPDSWTIDQRTGLGLAHEDTVTFVVARDAQLECQFFAGDNAATAAESPGAVHRQTRDRFNAETWTAALNQFSEIFPNNSARVEETSLDMTNFWPIQRAHAQSARGPVLAAFQQRPGVDIVTVCVGAGAAQAQVYDQVIHSVGHPSDSISQSAVEVELQNQGGGGAARP